MEVATHLVEKRKEMVRRIAIEKTAHAVDSPPAGPSDGLCGRGQITLRG